MDLEREGARNVTASGKQIRFRGKFWSLDWPKLHFVYGLSSGEVEVDCWDHYLGVGYQISFVDWLISFLVWIGWGILMSLLSKSTLIQALGALTILCYMFGVAYAINVAWTCYFFNRFMENRLNTFFSSMTYLGIQGKLLALR